MPIIRFATPADWPFWQTLDRRISRELFRRKAEAGECYIAGLSDAPVGLLRWNRFWDEVPFCTLLYIDEKSRGQGLGRALVARWEEDMRGMGHGMAMTSTQSDEDAQYFWRAVGYKDAGSFDVDVPGYAQPPELIMLKDLKEER
jgi:GNAT superfamily N-acetyltransferase